MAHPLLHAKSSDKQFGGLPIELLEKEKDLSRQLALYEEMHERVSLMVAEPVLVVYLADSARNCLKRIHRRNRPYEQRIKLEFLEKLGDDYEKVFSGWKSSPVIQLATVLALG